MLNLKTGKFKFSEPLYLESGRLLSSYELVYETYGELNADKSNVVVICHALTGSHHAAGRYENDGKAGWWDGLIGSGKAVDTDKYFVICVSILGSCYGSTSPLSIDISTGKQYRLKFPVLTISDVVKAQIRLFNELRIYRAKAVIGGSLGGMQALCFAIEFPNFAERIIMLASTYQSKAWAIAFNKIAISAIVNDPEFKNGEYDENFIKENGLNGLSYGRMAGHISFLSPDSMDTKFGRNYVQTDGLYELFGRFEVDRYMDYNGFNFPKRFDPLSYLYIVKMMNIFDCTRHYDSLKDALSPIKSHLSLIAFKGDLLFPPSCMSEIYDTFCDMGRCERCEYIEINSSYGHDAFLVEIDKFEMYVKRAIEREIKG
ncbi:homoserine O-acetyltransferase [Campylobacter sp. faydin G-140]|uniref:homoserine O-acetyltransferase MetX n=1 Tax=Campylobacter anatolicus TaxID=2829105 RepID=UPI001B95E798|nr:homoserine O-acetyltransferase [Campylobacter anatolicus]MBR8462405.1 homoserine O-acetyltransferase [Campylobacter anatolicus]MBR8465534.1 homoserine O-acetyltransferase [Campylobacter anatolicus]